MNIPDYLFGFWTANLTKASFILNSFKMCTKNKIQKLLLGKARAKVIFKVINANQSTKKKYCLINGIFLGDYSIFISKLFKFGSEGKKKESVL